MHSQYPSPAFRHYYCHSFQWQGLCPIPDPRKALCQDLYMPLRSSGRRSLLWYLWRWGNPSMSVHRCMPSILRPHHLHLHYSHLKMVSIYCQTSLWLRLIATLSLPPSSHRYRDSSRSSSNQCFGCLDSQACLLFPEIRHTTLCPHLYLYVSYQLQGGLKPDMCHDIHR